MVNLSLFEKTTMDLIAIIVQIILYFVKFNHRFFSAYLQIFQPEKEWQILAETGVNILNVHCI